jgi:hypothetical protein
MVLTPENSPLPWPRIWESNTPSLVTPREEPSTESPTKTLPRRPSLPLMQVSPSSLALVSSSEKESQERPRMSIIDNSMPSERCARTGLRSSSLTSQFGLLEPARPPPHRSLRTLMQKLESGSQLMSPRRPPHPLEFFTVDQSLMPTLLSSLP